MSSFAARCGILLPCRWFDAKSSALCCQTFTMRWKVGGQNHLRVAASSMAALAALARGSKSLLNFKTGCAALAATLRSKTPGSWSLAQGEVRSCASEASHRAQVHLHPRLKIWKSLKYESAFCLSLLGTAASAIWIPGTSWHGVLNVYERRTNLRLTFKEGVAAFTDEASEDMPLGRWMNWVGLRPHKLAVWHLYLETAWWIETTDVYEWEQLTTMWFYSMAALLRRGPQKVLGTAWYVLICLVYHCFYSCCCSNLEVLWLVVLAFFFTKVWTGLQCREFEQKWPPFTGVEMGWRSLYVFSVFPRPSNPCWSRVELSTIASHLKFICRKSTWNKAWGSKKNKASKNNIHFSCAGAVFWPFYAIFKSCGVWISWSFSPLPWSPGPLVLRSLNP